MHGAHNTKLTRQNLCLVKKLYPQVTDLQLLKLRELSRTQHLSIAAGDMIILDGKWYVTASGLLRLAQRKHCTGIQTELEASASNPAQDHWVFKATVFKSGSQRYEGWGDASPSNVPPLAQSATLRVAETRAVNRAIRKAFAVGLCSVEEIGSSTETLQSPCGTTKLPPRPANGNYGGPKVRDRLCELIRRHQLDAGLVKSYASDYCQTKQLRDATREQVEAFVTHLAKQAEEDRDSLLCQLNSYIGQKEGAA